MNTPTINLAILFPEHEKLALAHIKQACKYADAHVSRATDRAQVTRFLNFTGLPFADPDTGSPYPFCAAGGSYSLAHAYCDVMGITYTEQTAPDVFKSVIPILNAKYILISASCELIREDAVRRGTWIPKNKGAHAKPGWIGLFNFENETSEAHHYTIVMRQDGDTLHTVEFNTSDSSNGNGGAVAYKIRDVTSSHFRGFVKTY